MRISNEIPDAHAPALLEFIAELLDCSNRSKERIAEDYQADEEKAVTVPLVESQHLTAAPELPMPADLPALPNLPEGKTRWAYLGTFPDSDVKTEDGPQFPTREIRWLSHTMGWQQCWSLNGGFHHIEAI